MVKEGKETILKKQINQLKKDVTNLKEQMKFMQRKLDFTQDEMARLAVFGQALIQSVNFIVQTAKQLSEKENIQQQMGLPRPVLSTDPNSTGNPPTVPPPPGTGGIH